jgi:hypothetical protein
MLAPGIVTIAIELNVPIRKVTLLTGYQLLVVGCTGYIPQRRLTYVDHL